LRIRHCQCLVHNDNTDGQKFPLVSVGLLARHHSWLLYFFGVCARQISGQYEAIAFFPDIDGGYPVGNPTGLSRYGWCRAEIGVL
jgi:hypothetical protein